MGPMGLLSSTNFTKQREYSTPEVKQLILLYSRYAIVRLFRQQLPVSSVQECYLP